MGNKQVVKAIDLLGLERIRLIGNDGSCTEMQMTEFATYVSARYSGVFAGLPAASTANKLFLSFITDAPASPTPYGVASGGGTLTIPVYSDGVTWRNG